MGTFQKKSLFTIILCSIISTAVIGEQLNNFTPVPLGDIVKDLIPLYFGNRSDYFISTYPANRTTAKEVCQTLTDLTGKRFNLLMLETKEEAVELHPYLDYFNSSGIWIAGEKTFNQNGDIALVWILENGEMKPIDFTNFRNGALRRSRRSISDSKELNDAGNSVQLLPWINVGIEDERGGRCRNGKYTPPECKPIECNMTVPDCDTKTPDCSIRRQQECTVQRPPSSAKCENCTVTQPVCYAKPGNCTVKTEDCLITQPPCTLNPRIPCNTTRPTCKTIQPPCDVTEPPPCTTKPPCIPPAFQKENCTTETPPCTTNSKNETFCPPPRTVCNNEFKCPPPEACHRDPIICPPPIVFCESEKTECYPPTWNCPKPILYCPKPEVVCEEAEIICTPATVECSPAVVNSPNIVTSCEAPEIECPPPDVTCPAPILECSDPEPCFPPDIPITPCPTDPPPTTTTTQRPCPGCGCIFMSKEHKFQWDISDCDNTNYFICEG